MHTLTLSSAVDEKWSMVLSSWMYVYKRIVGIYINTLTQEGTHKHTHPNTHVPTMICTQPFLQGWDYHLLGRLRDYELKSTMHSHTCLA